MCSRAAGVTPLCHNASLIAKRVQSVTFDSMSSNWTLLPDGSRMILKQGQLMKDSNAMPSFLADLVVLTLADQVVRHRQSPAKGRFDRRCSKTCSSPPPFLATPTIDQPGFSTSNGKRSDPRFPSRSGSNSGFSRTTVSIFLIFLLFHFPRSCSIILFGPLENRTYFFTRYH